MADAPHNHFTASATSYLRNLDREDLTSECVAVHYQKAPRRHEDGTKSLSLNFPLLIVSLYAGHPHEVAQRVADILNKHWDEADA